jgi:hypothetical protein
MNHVPPPWLNKLSNKEFHDLLVVSVDLCGSSSMRRYLEEAFKIHAAVKLIRNCIERWGIECNGAKLFWAGDGGAFLFQPNANDERHSRYDALRFAVGIRYMCWGRILRWDMLKELSNGATHKEKLKRDRSEESVLLQTRTFVETHCPLPSTATPNPAWFADLRQREHWYQYQNPDGPIASTPTFRIVCHKADDVCIDPSDLQTVFGEDLSYVLKYERELGVENAITITDDFKFNVVPDSFLSQDVECLRRKIQGGAVTLRVHPPIARADLHLLVNSGLSATHFKTSNLVEDQNLLVRRILACFRGTGADNGNSACIYNIGLGTLMTNLTDLWLPMIGIHNINIKLLLLDQYLDNKEKVLSTKKIIADIFAEIEHRNPESWPVITRQFEENVTAKTLKREMVNLNTSQGSDRDFGPGFGCSLYFKGARDKPVEGSNVFLTAPFSQWTPLPNKSGYWTYQRAFYFSDVHAAPYLEELSTMFNKYWRDAQKMNWPWED